MDAEARPPAKPTMQQRRTGVSSLSERILETDRSHHHTCSSNFASTHNQEDVSDGIGRRPKPIQLRAASGVDREAPGFVVVRSVTRDTHGSGVTQTEQAGPNGRDREPVYKYHGIERM